MCRQDAVQTTRPPDGGLLTYDLSSAARYRNDQKYELLMCAFEIMGDLMIRNARLVKRADFALGEGDMRR